MLTIGDRFPAYRLEGVVSNDVQGAFQDFDERSDPGKGRVFFFHPKDFTFVCPTETAGFAKLEAESRERDPQLYANSTDDGERARATLPAFIPNR